MQSRFDIVVPCYRYGHYLKQCVDSVLSQRGVEVRVLIIDDASPDDSAAVARQLAESDPRVSFIHHQANKGHIATYNEGLALAAGDYVLLLSADDYLLPGALARAAAILDARPDIGLLFGAARALLDGGKTLAMQPLPAERIMTGAEFMAMSGGGNPVPTPTAIVRTSVQHAVGGYSAELPHTADMEMWLRIAARSSVAYLASEQAVYRRHEANMSLSYYETMLPDILQRQTAIANFFKDNGHLLADAQAVQSLMLEGLAREAAGSASAAFNRGDLDLCERLSALALQISGSVVRSRQWRNLEIKRFIGLRLWQVVAAFSGKAASAR